MLGSKSIVDLIAGLPTSPRFDRMMHQVSNPSPGNAAPYLIPEAAVITGRSTFSAIRNGFIEFQERFLEETVVAVLWFFGVSWMEKLFDKLKHAKWVPDRIKHLDLGVDWGFSKAKGMTLSSAERYAFNNKEWKGILAGKAGRMAFATGITLGLVAFVVPWLNQVKTDWLLKKFYGGDGHGGAHIMKDGKPHQQPKSDSINPMAASMPLGNLPPGVQALLTPEAMGQPTLYPQGAGAALGQPFRNPTTAGLLPGQNPAWTASRTMPAGGLVTPAGLPWPGPAAVGAQGFAHNTGGLPPNQNPAWTTQNALQPWAMPSQVGFSPVSQLPRGLQPQYTTSNGVPAAAMAGPVRFGFAGSGVLQLVGHAIENTDVGRMLVIDTGITGGRAVVAGKRSGFESAEIIFRDAVSLYFYILAVPHVMKLLKPHVAKSLGASVMLDPTVANELTTAVLKDSVLQKKLASGAMDTADAQKLLARVLLGEDDAIRSAVGQLKLGLVQEPMRTVAKHQIPAFTQSLAQELALMMPENLPEADRLGEMVKQALGAYDNGLNVNQASRVVEAIQQGKGPFGSLAKGVRHDLTVALKQAFGSHVGVTAGDFIDGLRAQGFLAGNPAEWAAFEARVAEVAAQDSRELVNTLLRRAINPARYQLTLNHPVVKALEDLSVFYERAASNQQFVSSLVQSEFAEARSLIAALKSFKVNATAQAALDAVERNQPVTQAHLEALQGLQAQAKTAAGSWWTRLNNDAARSASKLAQQLESILPALAEGYRPSEGIEKRVAQLFGQLQAEEALSANAKAQMSRLFGDMERLAKPAHHRLISLVADGGLDVSPEMVRKTNELLKGGLVNQSGFLRKALRLTGAVGTDYRAFVNPEKLHSMVEATTDYAKTLIANLDRHRAGVERTTQTRLENLTQEGLEQVARYFQKLSKNAAFLTRWAGFTFAMVGLGILVPKMQNAMTKHLTGKNEHPGIAAARKAAGLDAEPSETASIKGGQQSIPVASGHRPINRNNQFALFAQPQRIYG